MKHRIEVDFNNNFVKVFFRSGDMETFKANHKTLDLVSEIRDRQVARLVAMNMDFDLLTFNENDVFIEHIHITRTVKGKEEYLKNIEANGQYKNQS